MINTKYKGSRRERQVAKILEAAGYTVTKAGASLGVFDLIAIGRNGFILCQVKANRWPGSDEASAIERFVCPDNCRKVAYRWRDGKTAPDIRELTPSGQWVTTLATA